MRRLLQQVSRATGGFTLIELLIVLAVIGILASLLLPAASQARARGIGSSCVSRLKQAGSEIIACADDRNGAAFVALVTPETPPRTWASVLLRGAAVDPDAASIYVCPGYPPRRFDDDWYRTFGVRRDLAEDAGYTNSAGEILLYLSRIAQPSEYLHLADTTSFGKMNIVAQQFYEFTLASGVHARHNNIANGLFADGHVETCGRDRLVRLGVTALYGIDTTPPYF